MILACLTAPEPFSISQLLAVVAALTSDKESSVSKAVCCWNTWLPRVVVHGSHSKDSIGV